MDKKLSKAVEEIYKRMFSLSRPSIDYSEIKKSGIGRFPLWFQKFYLNGETQKDIIDCVCIDMGIKGFYKRRVEQEVHLGYSPTDSIKCWKKAWGLKEAKEEDEKY